MKLTMLFAGVVTRIDQTLLPRLDTGTNFFRRVPVSDGIDVRKIGRQYVDVKVPP
jgi:hypothetical protein